MWAEMMCKKPYVIWLVLIIACAIFVVEIRQDAEQDDKRPKQNE